MLTERFATEVWGKDSGQVANVLSLRRQLDIGIWTFGEGLA